MSTRPDSERSSTKAKQDMERARQETSRAASEAAETAREVGKEKLHQAKDAAAARAEEMATALDEAADDLERGDGAGTMVSGYGHSMAGLMRRLAGGLRDHEIEDFVTELSGFARRSPGAFLAGSVALGFGVSRLLKATSDRREEWEDDEDYDVGYDYDDESFATGRDSVSDEYGMQTAATDQYRSSVTEPYGSQTPYGSQPSDIGDETRQSEYPAGATGEPAANRKPGDEGVIKQ